MENPDKNQISTEEKPIDSYTMWHAKCALSNATRRFGASLVRHAAPAAELEKAVKRAQQI